MAYECEGMTIILCMQRYNSGDIPWRLEFDGARDLLDDEAVLKHMLLPAQEVLSKTFYGLELYLEKTVCGGNRN